MSELDRRMFVMNAGALLAATVGQSESVSANQVAKLDELTADGAGMLNLQFRDLYKQNRDELLSSAPLAALMLIGTGEVWRVEFGVAVKSYPTLPWIAHVKGLMHGVIATQATVARLERSKSGKTAITDAGRLAKSLATAEKLVVETFPGELTPAGQQVIRTLRTMAEGWVAGRPGSVAEFSSTMKGLQPDLQKVIAGVGEAIYESVIAGLRKCAAESDPDLWGRCLVGVCGVGFARRDNIEIAAAMSVMGRDAVGTRLLYLENAFTIPDGIRQLAASLADLELGRDVFDDPFRMWRDLLGDVAIKHAGEGFFPELGKKA